MMGAELHVQAGVWVNGREHAALFMEGESLDRANGGGVMSDALHRVVLARGLHLTTDLDHLDFRPVHGWRVWLDDARTVTLEWPRFRPLFDHAPLDLPEDWTQAAKDEGFVVLFAGYGMGIHEHLGDGESHPVRHLQHAAEMGALASGVVPVSTTPMPVQQLVL